MITKRDNDFRWSEQIYKIIPFAPKITGHDLGQVILHHSVNNSKSTEPVTRYTNAQLKGLIKEYGLNV